ncbi:uncharacterized protein LOC135389414 [Ornithodoros turicata]|uniref:uncharacterized protein LOC135389414 n=1 Tax=Ornithodoros turicata TaxID=34597 RepID=UPI00313A2615
MAASNAASASSADFATEQTKKKRFVWSDAMTRHLLNLWEDSLGALRSQKRNAVIYDRIASALTEGCHGATFVGKQVRMKIESLTKEYRALARCGTGSAAITWPYFRKIHGFLGTLPVNDLSLVEESIQLPELQLHYFVYTHPHNSFIIKNSEVMNHKLNHYAWVPVVHEPEEGAEVVASAPQEVSTEEEPQENVDPVEPPPRKKEKNQTVLMQLLQLSKAAEKRAAKADKKERKMRKRALHLQEEANQLQREMLHMMNNYFNGS